MTSLPAAVIALLSDLIIPSAAAQPPEPSVSLQSLTFERMETAAGPRAAQRGVLRAPLFHDAPERGSVQLPFLRFSTEADSPGPPVFLLAGGPGSTYRDDLEERDFLRWLDGFLEFGDVVMLEQRGSRTTPASLDCAVRADIEPADPITPEAYQALLAGEVSECAQRYRRNGVPLEAFTIVEMAQDFHLLREALGYGQMNLVGGSFGSQLGFAIIRVDESGVHRAIFYGVEGPGDTLDRPEFVDHHIDRVARALDDSWQFRLVAGDLRNALERWIARLEADPLRGSVNTDTGERAVTVGAFDLKLMLWSKEGLKGYREPIARVGRLLAALRLGLDHHLLEAKVDLVEGISGPEGSVLDLMTFLVDCSSVPAARHLFPEPDPSHLFGPDIVDGALRATCGALDLPVIPGADRAIPEAETPIVLVSGGLDGFTPPEYAQAAARRLPNAHLINVPAGDHDGWAALESDPAHFEAALAFLEGRLPAGQLPSRIDLAPIRVRLVPNWLIVLCVAISAALVGGICRRPYRRTKSRRSGSLGASGTN
jgi:pimeloyl-ACP methyl ester carboxylesterase